MVDLNEILEFLSGASTIAVILGVPFIVLQMRQNARMLEVANRQTELVALQNRSQVMLNIAEHLTDHDFILARRAVRDIIAKYNASGWESFADSVDGFEVRAFASQYESAAIMARLAAIDEAMVVEALGVIVAIDWNALRPAMATFEKAWGRLTFPNFSALAAHSEQYWKARGMSIPSPDTLIPPDRSGRG
jgi:acyl-CoA reductase-like NAD-dependent aldehyde dehydrogenase